MTWPGLSQNAPSEPLRCQAVVQPAIEPRRAKAPKRRAGTPGTVSPPRGTRPRSSPGHLHLTARHGSRSRPQPCVCCNTTPSVVCLARESQLATHKCWSTETCHDAKLTAEKHKEITTISRDQLPSISGYWIHCTLDLNVWIPQLQLNRCQGLRATSF